MLTDADRDEIAKTIYRCYSDKTQTPLLNTAYPGLEMEDSYRIQERVVRLLIADGGRVCGYKIGLTSKAMQDMAGSTEPDYSALVDQMFLAEGGTYAADQFIMPMAEIELAFVMKSALSGPGVTVNDVVSAIDYVVPAIEIVDFRVKLEPGFDVRDTIADLAAVGAVVVGARRRRLDEVDLNAITGELRINGESKESGEASAVLGNPLNAVVWLANRLADFDVTFQPGDTILAGSFIRAVPIGAGDAVIASFSDDFGDVAIELT